MRQSKGHCVRCVAKCHSGLEGGNRAEASIFENARDGKEREGQRERPTQVRGWPAGRPRGEWRGEMRDGSVPTPEHKYCKYTVNETDGRGRRRGGGGGRAHVHVLCPARQRQSVCLRGRWVDFGGRSTSNSNLENHSNHNFYVTSAARIVPANRPAKP